MPARALIRRLFPPEFQPPSDLPHRALRATGYFRVRTRLAAHGQPIPDLDLYQPLYSPWEGDREFEPLYQAVKPHTLVARDRCWILWKTLQQALALEGDVVECGVFRGGTALLEARTIAAAASARELHLFDSFEGMPTTTTGIDRLEAGDLRTTSVADVEKLLSAFPFVHIHAGFIPGTFEGLTISSVAWAHIDVDIYQTVIDSVDFLYPRLVPGGFLVFDDYGFPSCAGARRAVDEAFAARPEVPVCLPTGQCLVVKL
jgi:O-methyltransferase